MKRNFTEMSHTAKQERPEKKMKTGYMGDPRLLPRVQQYLEARRDKKVVDLAAMVDDLQSRFGEYGRKKRAAFRKSVEKAYEHILRTHQQASRKDNQRKRQAGEDNHGESDDDRSDEFSEDNQEYTTYEDSNAMNSLMRNFYAKPGSRPGSRPSSQPGSGASTPIGSRSPFRPSEPDCTPTPLFTVDRTGNKALKESLNPKTKTPVSSPKPKVKQSHQVVKTVGLQDFTMEDGEESARKQQVVDRNISSLSAESPNVSRITASSKDQDLSDNQTETSMSKDAAELKDVPPTPKKSEEASSGRPVKKRRKQDPEEERKKKGPEVTQSKVTFADVGGNDKMLADVCKLLVHLKHPEVYRQLGVTPPRGFLLHGPPGCGKTLLAHAIAGELELPFIKVAATEIVSGVSGESEEKVRDTFQKAMTSAPCVLFIDEIDAITQKRENASKDMERRIVSQLLTCMDELNSCQTAHVLVIGATNRPDSLDPALRRAGRFDREISLGIPDQAARERILRVLCRELRLSPGLDLAHLSRLTPGYVGADLMALAREAAITAVNRVFKALQESRQNESEALCQSQPTEAENANTMVQGPETPSQTELTDSNDVNHRLLVDADSKTDVGNSGDVQMTDVPAVTDTPLVSALTDTTIVSAVTDTTLVNTHGIDQNEHESSSAPQETANATSNTSSISHDIVPEGMEVEEVQKAALLNRNEKDISLITNRDSQDKKEEAQQDLHKKESSQEKLEPQGNSESTFLQGLQQTAKRDSDHTDDLATVLSWLKDQPPLTDEQLQDLWIEMADFELAARSVQPSAKREGFATIPDVTWSDIGALHEVREELQMAILAPVRHPEKFRALGLTSPPGILLAGPPGCGKTLLAKAVANESGINFISVKGPELLNMYVGESERAVRQVFQRARNSAPCVIFFDELDALCPRRADGGEGGSSVRVVNQLLTEMDGLEERKQVFIMGATNRPDIIDPAVLRPGRLDKTLYVGLPGPADRHDILRTVTKNGTKPALTPEVDLACIASDPRCEGYTGADLAALVREAAVTALRELMVRPKTDNETTCVSLQHFNTAFDKIRPSVSEKDQAKYQSMNHRLRPS